MSHNAWHNARTMYEQDACAQAMGMDIIDMDEGYAVVTMTITPQMLNGHKTCHGGQLFSLADTAFAYACNSRAGGGGLWLHNRFPSTGLCRRQADRHRAG